MTVRRLHVDPLTIDATQTQCGECRFQHSETSLCILFGRTLEAHWKDGKPHHHRIKECAIAEWKAKKDANAEERLDSLMARIGGPVADTTDELDLESAHLLFDDSDAPA
jgi:hypothetical protein